MIMRIKFLFLTSLLMTNFLSAKEGQISTRIVGGQPSAENEWPWMVKVNSGPYVCGGTLIGQNTILTAAHCLYVGNNRIPASNIYATVGEYLLNDASPIKIRISKTYIHSEYDPNNGASANDIALLRLNDSITSITPLERINLATTKSAISLQDNVTILGWGSTVGYAPGETVEANYPNILNKATLPLQTDSQCRSKLSTSYDSSTMICAGFAAGGIDSCQGDSGGPMVYQEGTTWKQIGIVSWGAGCAEADYPGVYTRLATYDDWINNFISGITFDNQIEFTQIRVDESSTKALIISNNSTTDAQLTFSLNGSSNFAINAQNCEMMATKSTCSLQLTYSPNSKSSEQTELTIRSDLANTTPIKTTIFGTSYAPPSDSSGGGSLLFIFSIPLLLLRRFLKY